MSTRAPLVFKTADEDWEFELHPSPQLQNFRRGNPAAQCSADAPARRQIPCRKHLSDLSQWTPNSGHARRSRQIGPSRSIKNSKSSIRIFRPDGKICEIRLLAVEKKFRGAQVLQGILALLWQHGIEKSYDLAIISGTPRQFRLYQHLGFVPFGPLVGSGEAQFQPMYVTLETFEAAARVFLRSSPSRAFQPARSIFFPGRSPFGAKFAAHSSKRPNHIAPMCLSGIFRRPNKLSAN